MVEGAQPLRSPPPPRPGGPGGGGPPPPAIQPIELWEQTGRKAAMGDVLFQLSDRRGRGLALGPTHEEVITRLFADHALSYRDLPVTLYQIQTKFRHHAHI